MSGQNEWRNYLLARATPNVFDCAYETQNPLLAANRAAPGYSFFYLKSGRAQLRTEGGAYECFPGDIVLLPPDALLRHAELNIVQPSEFMRWSFQYQIDNTLDILHLFDFPAPAVVKDREAFERAFLQHLALFHSEPRGEKPSGIVLRQARAMEVISHLLDSLPWPNIPLGGSSGIPPAFHEILQQIISAPENGVHLKALAQQYHMHPTYISNRFKYHFGITPAQLCRQLVIEKARVLLLSENYTITEISSRLGFRDVSSFTQIFTEAEGITPSKYRRGRLLEESESLGTSE